MGVKNSSIIFLCVLATVILSSSVIAATYNSVKDIPAVCTGGTITSDSSSGTCRTTTCTGSSGSLQTLACDKPDTGTKQYFEIYKKTSSGTVPKICIDTACIQGNGYAKSSNYPIVQESSPSNTSNPPPDNTTTPPPSGEQCSSTVHDIPASCTGGSITSDSSSGSCRTLTCQGSSGSISVLACNKPDSGAKTYFEMYKKSSSGTVPKLCIGPTCLQSAGYAKSSTYPICTSGGGSTTNPPANNTTTNNTNTNTTTPTASGDVGQFSTLFLDYGSVNGRNVYDNGPSNVKRDVPVTPGQKISGYVQLEYNNSWAAGTRVVIGITTSWGDNSQSFIDKGTLNSGTGYINIPFNFTAPSETGKHHIIIAYRAETTTAHVMSMTNWAAGSPVWNDGNDIADWSETQISEANNNGRVLAPVKVQGGMRNYEVPATALEVNVIPQDELSESQMNIIVNGQSVTVSSSMPESERTFNVPVRDWSLAGVFFESAGFTSYETGAKEEVYREEGAGGKVVSDSFCDASLMNVELLGSDDVSSTNPARVHILRTQPGYQNLDVILNFAPTNSNKVTGTVSPDINWDNLGEAFIHQFIRDRNDFYLQHYFIEGSASTAYDKTVFLQTVNQSIAEGKTKITLSSERIKHPTDATAKNKYTFVFEHPSTGAKTTMVIESEYVGEYNVAHYDLWQGSRYDIYLLRKAGIPVNEFSTIDSHWRSAECAEIEAR
jgi:hypothetical protein